MYIISSEYNSNNFAEFQQISKRIDLALLSKKFNSTCRYFKLKWASISINYPFTHKDGSKTFSFMTINCIALCKKMQDWPPWSKSLWFVYRWYSIEIPHLMIVIFEQSKMMSKVSNMSWIQMMLILQSFGLISWRKLVSFCFIIMKEKIFFHLTLCT